MLTELTSLCLPTSGTVSIRYYARTPTSSQKVSLTSAALILSNIAFVVIIVHEHTLSTWTNSSSVSLTAAHLAN